MTSEQADRPLETSWAATPVERARAYRPGRALSLAERRLLLLVVDLLLVNGALVLAATLWVDFTPAPQMLLPYGKWFVVLSLVWLVVASVLDVYDPVRAASVMGSLTNCSVAALVAGALYLMIPWFTPPPTRRLFFLFFLIFLLLGVIVWRVAYARLFVQPAFQRRVLIVGQDATARRVAGDLEAAARAERANPFRGTGYHVVGLVDGLPVGSSATLDPGQAFVRLVRSKRVDEVLVGEGARLTPELQEALLDCREVGIPVVPLSAAYERLAARLPVAYAEQDLRLITQSDDSAGQRLYQAAKRAMDGVLALAGLLPMVLLMPIIALGNLLTSPGPLFYRQQRVGRGGSPFTLFKFRTMVPAAEQGDGAVWAAERDPRVTPVGRWLRRLRLDELPQVVNVLRGEMSMVGPRPERPQFVGQLSRALPLYRARHSVRPGITGWAQIRYPYGSSMEDARCKLEYDLYYIKHAGLILDMLILLRTVPVVFRMQGH